MFIRGLSRDTLDRLCKRRDAAVAIVNPGDAFVLGGTGEALNALSEDAEGIGAARAVRVAVNVASHTPRLAAASVEFRKVSTSRPAWTSWPSRFSHTVQWAACLEGCVEAGASTFLELGPGRALSEMAASAYPDIPARSLEDFRTLQGARAWLLRTPSSMRFYRSVCAG